MSEMIKRIVQGIFSSPIFNVSGIKKLRIIAYKLLFNIGKNADINYHVKIARLHNLEGKIKIGNNVSMGYNLHLDYSGGIIIEDNVLISHNSTIMTHNHDLKTKELKKFQPVIHSPLHIGEDVFIGINCTILSNVKSIGKGAIIGAGSVVIKDVEPYTIVMGNPAKPIGKIR